MIQNLSEALQRLPPDEHRAFTADFPKLLIEWYRGDAMYQTFQPVHARTGSRVTASRWDQQTFAQFVHSIRLVSAALDVPNATLFRGVTLPEYSAPAVSKTKIDATPRNALHSWTPLLKTAQDFRKVLDMPKGVRQGVRHHESIDAGQPHRPVVPQRYRFGEVGNGECSRRRTAWMGSVVCHVDAIRQTKLNHLPWRAAHSGKDHQTFLPRAAHDNGASLLNNFQHL